MDVSIIIPTKNRLWSLPKAVESCRSREIAVQIIVIDDASDDGTAEWLRTQADVVVVNGEGWGKPWGVNRAQPLATGDYIRFLDSDDWLNPGVNKAQLAMAQSQNADVVVAGYDIYKDDVLTESQPWILTDDFIAQQLGETSGSHYSAFLFRRNFIQDIPHRTLFPASDFASRDDRCFVIEVALRHPKTVVYDTPTLCHRRHERGRLQFQTGLRRDATHIQQLYVYRQVLRLLEERGELTTRRKKAAAKVLWPLAHWIAYSYRSEGGEVADWVFKLDPEFKIPEQGLLGSLYRGLGFRGTERVLALRRVLLRPFTKTAQRKPLGMKAL